MKLKLEVPTTLHDITLDQYSRFVKAFDNEDDASEQYAGLKMLEIFCGVKTAEALTIKISEIQKITTVLNKALDEKTQLITRFSMGGIEFGFVPQLDNLTFGEFVDIENNVGDWDTMYKAMAVLYRPVALKAKGKYTLQDYTGDNYHEAMKVMPASIVLGALQFFFLLEADLLKVTLASSLAAETKTQQDERPISTVNGGGITV